MSEPIIPDSTIAMLRSLNTNSMSFKPFPHGFIWERDRFFRIPYYHRGALPPTTSPTIEAPTLALIQESSMCWNDLVEFGLIEVGYPYPFPIKDDPFGYALTLKAIDILKIPVK